MNVNLVESDSKKNKHEESCNVIENSKRFVCIMQCDNIKDKIGAVLPNDALIFYESDMYDGWNFKFLNQMHNATAVVVQFWFI